MDDKVLSILNLAVNAPSGDNSQPWEFCVEEREVYIWNIPNADESFYNFQQRGTYFSHGALIENIIIAASAQGWSCEIDMLPKGKNSDCIAKFTFSKGANLDKLVDAISQRVTNRKPYSLEPIGSVTKEKLIAAVKGFPESRLLFLEEHARIQETAKTLSLNERLILEHRGIHDGLFSYIRWSDEEEREKGGGLNIKTLELAPPQAKAFQVFKNWKLLSILNRIIGVAKLVARDNVKLYAATPLFGMILMKGAELLDFINAGRCFERIWLTATSLGLHVQPTGALLYLAQRAREGDPDAFSVQQKKLIFDAETSIKRNFGVTSGIPAMLFRIGKADSPSAHSFKRPPRILSQEECSVRN